MACRNLEKAEEAKNDILKKLMDEVEKEEKIGVLVIKELDLSSLKSVRKCAQEILDEEPRIDLLINNAGKLRKNFNQKLGGNQPFLG